MSLTTKRVLIMVAGVVVAAAMITLGLWQMQTAKQHGRAAVEARAAEPPVPLTSLATGAQVDVAYGRPVSVTGRYLPEHQFYVGTKYPLKVVTAFRADDGRVLAIVRGLVDSPSTKAPPPPVGTLNQVGLMLPSDQPSRGSLPLQDARHSPIVGAVRLPDLVQTWPSPLINGYLTLTADEASTQSLSPAPVTLASGQESTRNAGYALQWWVFAGAALVGSLAVTRSMQQ